MRFEWRFLFGGSKTRAFDSSVHRVFGVLFKVNSWIVKYGPNGTGSLFFNTDRTLERMWLDYHAKIHWDMDIMVGSSIHFTPTVE